MILLLVFCATAIITYPVAAIPVTISYEHSIANSEVQGVHHSGAHAASLNGFGQHRIRRENDATKAPEVVKYYDSDSLVSRITVLSRDNVPLNPRIQYVNTAFVPGSDGYLVKSPKNHQNKIEKIATQNTE